MIKPLPSTNDAEFISSLPELLGIPNFCLRIMDSSPWSQDKARSILKALRDCNGVTVVLKDGRLWYGPPDQISLQHVATLVAFEKPLRDVLEAGFQVCQELSVDTVLGPEPKDGQFTEEGLITMGLIQGEDWGYTMEDGRMQSAINLSGVLKMLDRSADEQGWTDKERDELKQRQRETWSQDHADG